MSAISPSSRLILDDEEIRRTIRRMAEEILSRWRVTADLVLVGIRTRGVPLAEALAAEIERQAGAEVAQGTLDITLYRDDLSTIGPQPLVRSTSLPNPIDDKVVLLCDDVLFTGRTIRAALDAVIDYGRPRAIQLAVLIDRGHRELPIQADFVGRAVETTDQEIVEVRFSATDGEESVTLCPRPRA